MPVSAEGGIHEWTGGNGFYLAGDRDPYSRLAPGAGLVSAPVGAGGGAEPIRCGAPGEGDTNPQLSTLREVAQAFGKSLRELMFGLPGQRPTESAGLCDRVCRIVDSKDQAALSALEYGLRMAELLLERRFGLEGSGASGLLEADAAVTALQQRLPDGVAAHPSRESEPKCGRRRPPRR